MTPWTVACQAALSMEFSKPKYWSRLPFPTPEDLSSSGINPTSLASSALADRFFTTAPTGKYQKTGAWQATVHGVIEESDTT